MPYEIVQNYKQKQKSVKKLKETTNTALTKQTARKGSQNQNTKQQPKATPKYHCITKTVRWNNKHNTNKKR